MENAYDELGRAKGSTYVIGDVSQSYGITYEDISGMLESYTAPHNSFTYTYDAFDRLTRKLGNVHSIQYTYVAGSQRVATYTVSQAIGVQTVYAYTYDALGNITTIQKNGTTIRAYMYDALGRLTREVNGELQIAVNYTYDNAGNILTKQETNPMGGVISSVSYSYSASAWGDLLTGYNGTTISYDAIGNPLNWRNATNLSWHQRALQSMTLSDGTAVSFLYNADGLRTKKTVGSTVHDYLLDGSTILAETITDGATVSTLYYYYDESGISGLEYNGTKYSYIKNLQGDIVAIINAMGGTVVEYKYDAWGKLLSTTGSMASTLGAANPFRYRGYYYDTESGFYYLRSRYYDPQVGRFLNADGIIGANGDLMGYNMFAYCSNNPVIFSDHSGRAVRICLQETDVLTTYAPWKNAGGGGGDLFRYYMRFFMTENERLDADKETTTYNKTINNQKNLKFTYAGYNVSDNGCGPIAVHNALVLSGRSSKLSDVIEVMENKDATFIYGGFGTNPWQIDRALDYYRMDYTIVSLDEMDKEGIYIVSYWHQDFFAGAHNVAVEYDGKTYTTYNNNITDGHPENYVGFPLVIYYLG